MISFTIPGEPKGKARPRFFVGKNGKPASFSDRQTVAYERTVATIAKAAMRGKPPAEGPISVALHFVLAPAASASRAKLAAMLDGSLLPTKKPDLDNMAKAILDACNKVAFGDDAQVVSLMLSKAYGATPGTTVTMKALAQ